MSARTYLIEIHDATPASPDAFQALLALLPARAAAVASILVVPNWEEQWPLTAHPAFVDRLRRHEGEKVLHGHTHSLGPAVGDWLYFGTGNEGEFARLDLASAAARLGAATRMFTAALGKPAQWFCAPRWQMSGGAYAALASTGIPGTMQREQVSWGNEIDAIPALWFDDGERSVVRGIARVMRRRRITRLLTTGHPFRLVLHPRDLRFARSEIAALVDALESSGWRPLPLGALTA